MTDEGFGLYIHWPFCQAKCPYCDFNSHVAQAIDEERWLRAYIAEIDDLAERTSGRLLSTIFFGGGTPSLMSPDTVDGIVSHIRARWPMVNDPEITLEANPTSVEAGRFAGYAAAGVNRISIGVQSLRDADLRALGRLHSAAQARSAYDLARRHFSRVSFDLIYARQHQSPESWTAELREALEMAVDHLSLYQLTIEPGTAFGARAAAGRLDGLPDEDPAADMYFATQELTAAHGLPAYEVSNHAAPGAESRHNLIYWRSGDWGGIGPGAHGRLTLGGRRSATETHSAPGAWLAAVERVGHGRKSESVITKSQAAQELVMMGLRISEGVSLSRWRALDPDQGVEDRISRLEEMGMVARKGDILRATAAGRAVLNAVITELLA